MSNHLINSEMSEATIEGPEVSSTPTITAPTTTKVKDPRKVAQGKRLAEISKAAKAAKKKRLQEEAEQTSKHEGGGDYINYGTLFGIIGAVVGIGGLYLAHKDCIWKRKTVNENVKAPVESERVVVPKSGLITLEGFD